MTIHIHRIINSRPVVIAARVTLASGREPWNAGSVEDIEVDGPDGKPVDEDWVEEHHDEICDEAYRAA